LLYVRLTTHVNQSVSKSEFISGTGPQLDYKGYTLWAKIDMRDKRNNELIHTYG